jgi:hypothetical protein
VKETVSVARAINDGAVLPERVQEALGELVGAAKEGLLALSVGVGLGVLTEMLEDEVDEVVGPKGEWNRDRSAVRHGHDDGEVTLGGRRVPVRRSPARTADGQSEVTLATYEYFADRDPLARVVLKRMLAGVSTRHYRRTQEPVGGEIVDGGVVDVEAGGVQNVRGANPAGARRADEPTARRLAVGGDDDQRDRLKERMMIVALGITTEGVKVPLGLWEGSTEKRDRRDRAAVRPGRTRPRSRARNAVHRMRRAWAETDYDRELEQLQRLASELEHTHPGAAGSLREGMEETLTVTRLRITGKLKRTLESTNPAESMIDCVRTTQRNVKHRTSGETGPRWTAAGNLEAEKQFRKVIGYTQLPQLAIAIERRLHLQQNLTTPTHEAAIESLRNDHTRTVVTDIPRRSGQPHDLSRWGRPSAG